METQDSFFDEKNFLWNKLDEEYFDPGLLKENLDKLSAEILNKELIDNTIDNDLVSE